MSASRLLRLVRACSNAQIRGRDNGSRGGDIEFSLQKDEHETLDLTRGKTIDVGLGLLSGILNLQCDMCETMPLWRRIRHRLMQSLLAIHGFISSGKLALPYFVRPTIVKQAPLACGRAFAQSAPGPPKFSSASRLLLPTPSAPHQLHVGTSS